MLFPNMIAVSTLDPYQQPKEEAVLHQMICAPFSQQEVCMQNLTSVCAPVVTEDRAPELRKHIYVHTTWIFQAY